MLHCHPNHTGKASRELPHNAFTKALTLQLLTYNEAVSEGAVAGRTRNSATEAYTTVARPAAMSMDLTTITEQGIGAATHTVVSNVRLCPFY